MGRHLSRHTMRSVIKNTAFIDAFWNIFVDQINMPTTTRSRKTRMVPKRPRASNAGKSSKENRPRANSLSEDPATEVDMALMLREVAKHNTADDCWVLLLAAKYMT